MNNEEEKIINETEEKEEKIIKDQEEFTYTVDNNNINGDYNKDDNNKSYIYIFIGVLILFIIIITLVVVVNKKQKKSAGYSTVESKLVKGAEKYYQKYPEKLPKEDDPVSVTAETLIESSTLKPFSEMVDKETTCTGYVNVYKIGEEYSYYPYLNCGTKYKSMKLNERIIEENLVTEKDGLYKENEQYIFKGEYPNNYIKFNNSTWRILKINEDKSIKIILIDKKPEKNVWDDRFNDEKSNYVGKNNFRQSRILEKLIEVYDNNKYINKENKKLLTKHNWCIGKIPEANTRIDTLNICSDTYNETYIGLITVDEVLKPSLDNNCKEIYDISCTNYNYLFTINTGWTLNTNSSNTYTAFTSNGGTISIKNASNSSIIRPVVNLNKDILYKSGNGTIETPYVID